MLDDLIDLTADEAEVGKPVGNDLRERKITIPLILALEGGGDDLRGEVARYYREEPDLDQAPATRRLADRILAAGGARRTRDAIAGYVERAKLSLAPLGAASARGELAALADGLARDSLARTR